MSSVMMKFMIAILLVFSFTKSDAQTEQLNVDTFHIRKITNGYKSKSKLKGYIVNNRMSDCDRLPSFKGGELALYDFIVDNLIVPPGVMQREVNGIVMSKSVYVIFSIDRKGRVYDARVVRSTPESRGTRLHSVLLDREAKRIVESMPNWTPAKIDGKRAKVDWILPIYFK